MGQKSNGGCWGVRRGWVRCIDWKEGWGILRVMDMFYVMSGVWVTWECSFVKTHQTMNLTLAHLTECKCNLISKTVCTSWWCECMCMCVNCQPSSQRFGFMGSRKLTFFSLGTGILITPLLRVSWCRWTGLMWFLEPGREPWRPRGSDASGSLSFGGPQGGGWRRGEGPGSTVHNPLQGALRWGGAKMLVTLVRSAWALREQAGPHHKGLWSVVRIARRMSLWPAWSS